MRDDYHTVADRAIGWPRVQDLAEIARAAGRTLRQRTTLYGRVTAARPVTAVGLNRARLAAGGY